MPRLLKRFYYLVTVLLIATCGWFGYWVATQQKSTGPAVWNTAQVTTMYGLVSVHPYPILHRFNPQNLAELQSVLLVSPGKHSATQLASRFAQQIVSVDGYEIQRGGWMMLELAGKRPIQLTSEATSPINQDTLQSLLTVKSLGQITLNGEIVDSKCFLGVMKPGAGTIHKACAEVCLLGDIPPMLVAKDARNQKFGYLLTAANRSSGSRYLAKFAAEAVQVTGQLQQQGDLLFIKVDDDGIRRL